MDAKGLCCSVCIIIGHGSLALGLPIDGVWPATQREDTSHQGWVMGDIGSKYGHNDGASEGNYGQTVRASMGKVMGAFRTKTWGG